MGKTDIANKTILPVNPPDQIFPDSLTPLAIFGQPAKRSTERRMRENTWAVDGSLEARTIEAERAEVRDNEDVRLGFSNVLDLTRRGHWG